MINGVPVYAFLSTTSTFTKVEAVKVEVYAVIRADFADRVGLAYPEVPAGDPL